MKLTVRIGLVLVVAAVFLLLVRTSFFQFCGRVLYTVKHTQFVSRCTEESSKLYLKELV